MDCVKGEVDKLKHYSYPQKIQNTQKVEIFQ